LVDISILRIQFNVIGPGDCRKAQFWGGQVTVSNVGVFLHSLLFTFSVTVNDFVCL